jgi:hypothetical protein
MFLGEPRMLSGCWNVRKRHPTTIADQTERTIVSKANQLRRLELNRACMASWRTRDLLALILLVGYLLARARRLLPRTVSSMWQVAPMPPQA